MFNLLCQKFGRTWLITIVTNIEKLIEPSGYTLLTVPTWVVLINRGRMEIKKRLE